MSKVINKTKGTMTISATLDATAQLKELQDQIAALKAQGAGKFKTWTSDKTNKVYLNVKLSQGRPLLLSRAQVEELIRDGKQILAACDELKVD